MPTMRPENVKIFTCGVMFWNGQGVFGIHVSPQRQTIFAFGPPGSLWVFENGKVVVTFTDDMLQLHPVWIYTVFFGLTHANNPYWSLSLLSYWYYKSDIIRLGDLSLVSSPVTTKTTTKRPSVISSMLWHSHLGVIPNGGPSQRSVSHRQCFKYSCRRHVQRWEDYFLPLIRGRGSVKPARSNVTLFPDECCSGHTGGSTET